MDSLVEKATGVLLYSNVNTRIRLLRDTLRDKSGKWVLPSFLPSLSVDGSTMFSFLQ